MVTKSFPASARAAAAESARPPVRMAFFMVPNGVVQKNWWPTGGERDFQLGRTMEVLVEGPSRTDETKLRGRTRHNKAVNFDGVAEPGEMVEVEITGATSQTLSGVAARPLSHLL